MIQELPQELELELELELEQELELELEQEQELELELEQEQARNNLSITKKDLANNISKKLRLSQKDSLFFVQSFFNIIIESHENSISIQKFGSFDFKKTPKRVGRNPKTLKEYEIRARKKLNFSPSVEIKKTIN